MSVKSMALIGGLLLVASHAVAATLDEVKARGVLRCGVAPNNPGFAIPDAQGNFRGFDVDFCKGIAAAIFGDGDKGRPVVAEPRDAFTMLTTGAIDVLTHRFTYTFGRDNGAGMEFASEMIVKATLAGQIISDVPTILSPDGRSRAPHLRSWRDGWRHLRFLLMMSPRWLLLYPGLLLLTLGTAASVMIIKGPLVINGVGFDIHTMLYAAGGTILGLQLILFSILARAVGCVKNVLPMTPNFKRFLGVFTLERGIVCGLTIGLAGLLVAIYSVEIWVAAQLAALDPQAMMRVAIPSVTLMLAGAEIIFASFILSFIDVQSDSITHA